MKQLHLSLYNIINLFIAIAFSSSVYAQDTFELIAKNETSKVLNNINNGSDPNEYNYQILRTDVDLVYNRQRVNDLYSYFVANKKNIPEINRIESLWEYEYSKIKGIKFGESIGQILIEDKIRENKSAQNRLIESRIKEVEAKIKRQKTSLLFDSKINRLNGYTPTVISFDSDYNVENKEYVYPIFGAIITKDYALVRKLIESGACLNISQQFSCFHKFNVKGNTEKYYFSVAGLLYEYATIDNEKQTCTNPELFYDFFTTDDEDLTFGYTPLSLLFAQKYADPDNIDVQELVKLMLEKGANPNFQTYITYDYRPFPTKQFFPTNMMVNAIMNNDIESVKLLCKYDYFLNTYFNEKTGKYFIKENSKRINNYKLFKSNSLTSLSEKYGNAEIVKILKEHGATRKVVNNNPKKKPSIKYLVYKQNYGAISSYIDKNDIYSSDMIEIIKSENIDIIRKAAKKFTYPHILTHDVIGSAYYPDASQEHYTTPFIQAIKSKQVDYVINVIENDTTNSLSGNYLAVCFDYALEIENEIIINKLLDRFDKWTINTPFTPIIGREHNYIDINSPFLSALIYNNPDVTKKLIDKGADVNAQFVYNLDTRINIEILDVNEDGNYQLLTDSQKDIFREFNTIQTEIRPILYYFRAANKQDPAIVSLLIKHGADVNFKCPVTNATPIYYANNFQTLKLLCDNGANPNVINYSSKRRPTALWNWIDGCNSFPKNHEEGIKALVNTGANAEIKAFNRRSKRMDLTLYDLIKNGSHRYDYENKGKKIKVALKGK